MSCLRVVVERIKMAREVLSPSKCILEIDKVNAWDM